MIRHDDYRFTLYSDGAIDQKYKHEGNMAARTTPSDTGLLKPLWPLVLSNWLKQDKPDLFWSPRHHIPISMSKNRPVVVTIHDVIWKTHPQTMRASRLANEKIKMPYAIKHSDQIICPSHATKDQILQYWPGASEKISVIAHGTTRFGTPVDPPSINKPYFLAVGTVEPRKNYLHLTKAFDQWASSNTGHDLVIIGHKAWGWPELSRSLNDFANSDRIHLIEGASDEQLAGYYQHAAAFIQVSLEEGFGMPVTEARQFGLPVMLSDIPVFREINPAAAVWVDPLKVDSISNGFTQILQTQAGTAEHLLPNWEQVCVELLNLFRRHL